VPHRRRAVAAVSDEAARQAQARERDHAVEGEAPTAPTVFIQITSREPANAAHAARKPGRRSGASADSSAGATLE
jgi:hypothetical protein